LTIVSSYMKFWLKNCLETLAEELYESRRKKKMRSDFLNRLYRCDVVEKDGYEMRFFVDESVDEKRQRLMNEYDIEFMKIPICELGFNECDDDDVDSARDHLIKKQSIFKS